MWGMFLQIKLNDEKNAYNFGSSTKVYVRIDGETTKSKIFKFELS